MSTIQSRSNIKKSLVSYKPSSLDIILAEMKTISGITKQKRDTFHFLYSSLQSLFLSIPRWCFVGKRDSVLPLWWWCSCCSERPMNRHRHWYRPNFSGYQAPFFGYRVPFFRYRVPFFRYRAPFFGYLDPFFEHIVPFFGYWVPFFGYQAPFIGYLDPFFPF